MTMPPLRLLHVLEATTAGVRRYVTQLLARPPTGWQAEVACPPVRQAHYGDTAFVDDVKRLGVPLHQLPLRRSIGPGDARAARELLALLRRERFDLLHTHSSKAGFIGRLAGRAAGVPVVHTPNGLYFLEQAGLKRGFYLALEWLAGRAATRLIAVSEGERQVVIRHRLARPDRIRLIENGVDPEAIRAQANGADAVALWQSLGLERAGPLVGGAGRLVPQKDPLIFVRAARQVLQTFPGAQFVWCGDGELRTEAERLAHELGVPLRVTGHLENVWAVMRRLDVFVLSSRYEGLPFTLLEAMALGVPVVAMDVIGARDVLKGTQAGWLVEPCDATTLAQVMSQVLAQPYEARCRAETALRLVETRFSIERMLHAHGEVYQECRSNHPSA